MRQRFVPSQRVLAALPLLIVAGATAGCAGSPGPSVGFHELTMAAAQDVPALCDEFFGTEDDLSERLGMTLYLEDVQQSGGCLYGSTAADDVVMLRVTETKPEEAALLAKGDTYFASLRVLSDGEESSIDRELREDVVEWLAGRADAVEDDLEEWVAGLPAKEAGLGTNDGFEFHGAGQEEAAVEGGTAKADTQLLTPYGTVSVAPWPARDYLWFDGEPMRPATGEKFVVASVFVEPGQGVGGDEFTLRVDGVDVTETVRDALDRVVLEQITQLLVSVPEDAETVEISVARPGDDDALQSISLVDGTIDDGGRGDLLANTVAGSAEAEETVPEVIDAEGQDNFLVGVHTPFWPFDIDWALVAWTPDGGWSPEGHTALVVQLNPVEPEKAAPLTTSDATAVVDGVEVPASAYDPETYSFTFSIPEGADRAEVQTRFSVPSPHPAYTVTGPFVHDISIDLHSGQAAFE